MGEKQTKPFQLSFNGLLKVDFQGSHVTSDGGLILVRELDQRLGLGELIDEHLTDSRQGTNKQFTLADLLRQSVYSRLAGYEDLNDAERVSIDPTFRLLGSQKIWDRGAALTSTLHGFETEMLASEENLLGLMALNRELVGQAEAFDDSERVVLDMDSTESPVHGQQEGSAYNGHFESVCYHPLLLFNQLGDCLAASLRPGNVHSAEDWDELLLPEIERQQAEGKLVTFRADAAFAKPEVYEALEERGVDYVIRIPAKKSLELEIEDILFRPPGRPSRKPLVRYKSFRYQAESWWKARRIVAKVEHHQGELFPRVGFIVTSMSLPSRSVVRFYNKRGTAEQWIKEGKQATHWTRLSCHRFRANEVRLQLSVLAYNLGNLWRRLGLPHRIKSWSLTSLQHRLMKTAKVLAVQGQHPFGQFAAGGVLQRDITLADFLKLRQQLSHQWLVRRVSVQQPGTAIKDDRGVMLSHRQSPNALAVHRESFKGQGHLTALNRARKPTNPIGKLCSCFGGLSGGSTGSHKIPPNVSLTRRLSRTKLDNVCLNRSEPLRQTGADANRHKTPVRPLLPDSTLRGHVR